MSDVRIEIFCKAGCPYCAALKLALDRDGVPYVEHDVQRDPEARQRMLQLNGNRRNVPTMVKGSEVTVGYNGM